ncbi:MAG: hypothetical protein GY861_03990 [bacterium]|nr:hypothetical protein [bacterium]
MIYTYTMKVVELNKETVLNLLQEAIEDIVTTGEIPSQCIILTDDYRYVIGLSEDEMIATFQRQIVDLCTPEYE